MMASKVKIAAAVAKAEASLTTSGLVLNCEDGSVFSFDTLFNGGTVFSLVSPSDERYTYLVEEGKKTRSGKDWRGTFFVRLLAGPSNTTDYRDVGVLQRDGSLRLSGRYTGEALPVAAFRWFAGVLKNAQDLMGVRCVPSGFCRRCKALLTVENGPDNPFRKYNLGPVCGYKVFGG